MVPRRAKWGQDGLRKERWSVLVGIASSKLGNVSIHIIVKQIVPVTEAVVYEIKGPVAERMVPAPHPLAAWPVSSVWVRSVICNSEQCICKGCHKCGALESAQTSVAAAPSWPGDVGAIRSVGVAKKGQNGGAEESRINTEYGEPAEWLVGSEVESPNGWWPRLEERHMPCG